jgi:predicted acylesterase/phospholipase RssA
MPKRAICLAGGGPAAGLHIGVLQRLKEGLPNNEALDFDVWALSCIGAWVGVVYNQAESGKEVQQTYDFFRQVFRDDKSFKSFPMNTVFAPDLAGNAEAMMDFLFDAQNYRNAFLPKKIMESFLHSCSLLSRERKDWKWSEGDFNQWVLNHFLAVNPAMRFSLALLYKSQIDGLFKLNYPDSGFLQKINFGKLNDRSKPYIFYNAFNFETNTIDLFANNSPTKPRKQDHKAISAESLCACSALPFVEQTVEVDGTRYCEGALVDTVNFESLLKDHHRPQENDGLDEIWISRIIDAKQIRPPNNLHDAFANLCQLFAATVGEDDVRLFEYHVREDASKPNAFNGTIVEIRVDSRITFDWSHENLDTGRRQGYLAADEACKKYIAHRNDPLTPALVPDLSGPGVRIIR